MDTIIYNEECWFSGRDGIFQQAGMQVKENKVTKVVGITPVTRNEKLGNGYQEIPIEHIPEFIGYLSKIYNASLIADHKSKISGASDEELMAELKTRNLLTDKS